MKIAINTRLLLNDRLEGIGHFTYAIAKQLVLTHPEHEFIFLFDRPFDESFIFAKNVKGVVLFPPSRHPILWYLWFEWAVPVALKKYKVDVFLSTDGFLSLNTNVPTVMVTHDIAYVHYPKQIPFLVEKYYRYFVPKFLERADKIITVSEFVKRDIHQYYHTSLEKITVSHNAATGRFTPLSLQERQHIRKEYANSYPYFFYVGAIHPRKNIERLLLAFDLFKQQTLHPVQLLIGGRLAWQTGTIKKIWGKMHYQSDVHFLGFVPSDSLPKLMGAANIFIYPSLSEGFGIPLLEAMQVEVPIITSNTTSLPEVAGSAALLVNPLSVEELAAAMKKLYENENLQQQLIENGRQQRQRYTWESAAAIVYETLEDVFTTN